MRILLKTLRRTAKRVKRKPDGDYLQIPYWRLKVHINKVLTDTLEITKKKINVTKQKGSYQQQDKKLKLCLKKGKQKRS